MISWKNLRIRHKLMAGYLTLFIASITAGSMTIYLSVRKTIEKNIESELNNSTNALFNLVRTSTSLSIKSHLKAVAEKNREIVSHYYTLALEGKMTQEEAKQQAATILLSQSIGKSGYLYCINSYGTVTLHPKSAILGRDVSNFNFVQEQIKKKEGYIEYQWKNPGETKSRSKALYMSFFKPWDWIISASSYRSEFRDLIQVEDIRSNVLSMTFGRTGYSYITDGRGNTIIHPKMEGINIFAKENIPSNFFRTMLKKKHGKIIYSWKNPGESAPREKLVIYHYMPEFDWIVASSSYVDEFYAPLDTVGRIFFAITAVTIILVIFLTFKISSSITTPLARLMNHLEKSGTSNPFTKRLPVIAGDEIGTLTTYFNTFMDRLEQYSRDLELEIMERKDAEKALLGSEKRYRQALEMGDSIRRRIGQNLHDDLCPHLLGIEGYCRVLQKRVETASPDDSQRVENIRQLISDAARKARHLSRGLCPAHLVAHGLISALEEICHNVEAFSRIRCRLDARADIPLENKLKTHLFYIIQEAVHNAVKHGEPDNITITITEEKSLYLVTVDDDGRGMGETSPSRGMGLKIMTHRTRRAAWNIVWEKRAARGTRVKITLPKGNAS